MSAAIELAGVTRRFGAVKAVDRVSFTVAPGEFFSMLGPSGSGKTTCLRLVAGFEHPDEGVVSVGGRSMAGVPPYERDVNTVFQDYALFPHLTVEENVAFGPMVKGTGREERRRRAHAMLEVVRLPGLGGRRPGELSGGQRQRVALARALINEPKVLLLDEPLGALDLKLREEMQVELKGLQRRLGITFVYVTHDQSEAMSMSDRVAVFHDGRLEQVAPPRELYHRPRTGFVASFVGAANVVDGEALAPSLAGRFAVRPEAIAVGPARPEGEALAVEGTVEDLAFLGNGVRVALRLPSGLALTAWAPSGPVVDGLSVGGPVSGWIPHRALLRLEGDPR